MDQKAVSIESTQYEFGLMSLWEKSYVILEFVQSVKKILKKAKALPSPTWLQNDPLSSPLPHPSKTK